MAKLKLKKEFDLDGEKVQEIEYSFDNLTGKNVENALKEAIKNGYAINGSIEIDPVLAAYIFAEAAGIDYTDAKRLNVVDYAVMASKVREMFISNINSMDKDDSDEDKIILDTPILIEGKEIKEITYNFDEMTGIELDNAFKSATKSGYIVSSSYEVDPVIGAHLFAEASNIKYSDILRLSFKDYLKTGAKSKYFFITSLGGNQEEEN